MPVRVELEPIVVASRVLARRACARTSLLGLGRECLCDGDGVLEGSSFLRVSVGKVKEESSCNAIVSDGRRD